MATPRGSWSVASALALALVHACVARALASNPRYQDEIVSVLAGNEGSKRGTVLYDFSGGAGSSLCTLEIRTKDHRGDDLALDLGVELSPEGRAVHFGRFKIFVPPDLSKGDDISGFTVETVANKSRINLSKGAVKDKSGGWVLPRKQNSRELLTGIASGKWAYRYYSRARAQYISVVVANGLPEYQRAKLLACVAGIPTRKGVP